MNFLSSVQRVHSEAGMSGPAPTTVISQSGEAGRAVNWVSSAYEDIQNLHPNWNFLRDAFSKSTVASTQTYTKAAWSLDELASYITDDIRVYSSEADETKLSFLHWDDFRECYITGSLRSQGGRPSVCSVDYNNSLVLYPTPDDVYTVNGEYFKRPQTMSSDTDTPLIPQQYQMIIVWRALLFYAGYEEGSGVWQHAKNEYNRLLRALEFNQLPRITWGKPLA